MVVLTPMRPGSGPKLDPFLASRNTQSEMWGSHRRSLLSTSGLVWPSLLRGWGHVLCASDVLLVLSVLCIESGVTPCVSVLGSAWAGDLEDDRVMISPGIGL